MKSLWATLSILLLTATSASAGPLAPELVPAGAKWVAHVNLDAVRNSALGEHLRNVPPEQAGQFETFIASVEERYAINLREDVTGMTAYGTSLEPNTGVVVVTGTFNPGEILAHFDDEGDYLESTRALRKLGRNNEAEKAAAEGEHQVRMLSLKFGENQEPRKVAVSLLGTDRIVMAPTADEVRAAITVVEGKGESLKGAESFLTQQINDSTVLHWAAVDVKGVADRARELPFLAQVDQARIDLDATTDQFIFAGTIEAISKEAAEQFKGLLQGFQGMAATSVSEVKDAPNIAENITVDAQDSTVKIDWKRPAEEVFQFIKAAHAKRGK